MKHLDIDNSNGTIFIDNGHIKESVCIWKHKAFNKHRDDKNIFIETGTCAGSGVLAAQSVGFTNIHTIEICNSRDYDIACNKFNGKENVNMYFGDSADILGNILNSINDPCFFG